MTESRFSIRLQAQGGKAVTAEFRGVGAAGSDAFQKTAVEVTAAQARLGAFARTTRQTARQARTSFRQVSRSAGNMRFAMQNAAFQVADVFTQINAGTSATRALSLQLPQLLGGIGVMGAVAGAALAAIVPLVSGLFEGAEGSDKFRTALDAFNSSAGAAKTQAGALVEINRRVGESYKTMGQQARGAADLVVATSRREFEARKVLLAQQVVQAKRYYDLVTRNVAAEESRLQEALESVRQTEFRQAAITLAWDQLPPSQRNTERFTEMLREQRGEALGIARQLTVIRAEAELAGVDLERIQELLGLEFGDVPAGGGGGGGSNAGNSIRKTTEFVPELSDELRRTQDAAREVGKSLGDAFASAVSGAKSFDDALLGVLKNLQAMIFNRAFQALGNQIAGAIFGTNAAGWKVPPTPPRLRPPSFAGGGYTGTGPRSGGLDGMGGFLAMLHPNETVIDNKRGGAGGGVVINQTINVQTGVAQTVQAEIARAAPQLAEMTKAAVLEARLAGGAYSDAF